METGSGETLKWRIKPAQLVWKLSDRAREWGQSRTLTPAMALGKRGENLAHRYLQSSGFNVIARNFKPGADSEIDIVARLDDLFVFVEVKTLSSLAYSAPERAVGPEKEKHIIRAARAFASRGGIEWGKVRFDIISIVMGEPPSISHFEDAFAPSY